jgi:hypothetical protein
MAARGTKRKAPLEQAVEQTDGPTPTADGARPLVKKRYQTTHVQKSVSEILELIGTQALRIPEHQRKYKWKSPLPEDFIDTVLTNGVTLSIVFNEMYDRESGQRIYYLENGFQRITTIQRFISDEFKTLEGCLYSELTCKEKQYINDFQFCVCIINNLSQKDIITQFERLNKGVTLTNAERIRTYCVSGLAPLMLAAERLLFAQGAPFQPTLARIHKTGEATPTQLYNTIALMSGCAFGSHTMSQSWLVIKNYIEASIEEAVFLPRLTHVMAIYAAVITHLDSTGAPKKAVDAFLKKLWDPSYIAAAILYTRENPAKYPMENPVEDWADFIHRLFLDEEMEAQYSNTKGKISKSWDTSRWEARANIQRQFNGGLEEATNE